MEQLRRGGEVRRARPLRGRAEEAWATPTSCCAVGAWKPGKLDIAGDVAGAIQWMKGVKAGNIGVAGNVAVIGGGNTAMDAARLAKRSGAEHVTLVYRRTTQVYARRRA